MLPFPGCITEFLSKYTSWLKNCWLWLLLSDFRRGLSSLLLLPLIMFIMFSCQCLFVVFVEWTGCVVSVLCAQDTQSLCLCVFLSDCALLKCLSLDFFCLESVGLKGLLKGSLQNLRMTACHKHLYPHICRSLVAILPETVGAVCFGKICNLQ